MFLSMNLSFYEKTSSEFSLIKPGTIKLILKGEYEKTINKN